MRRVIRTSARMARAGVLGSWLAILTAAPAVAFAVNLPAAPVTFDTTYAAPSGTTIAVNSGGDLQAALDAAKLGDTIVLAAGATFTGPFKLPNKASGTGWIYVTSSAYGSLPGPGARIAPTDAVNMPRIAGTATGSVALATAVGAHHFRFVGIEFAPAAGQFLYELIAVGNNDTSVATVPTNIVFDRCYIHSDIAVGGRRGAELDGAYIAVVDSYVSGFREAGADTQALWAYNGPGPLKIVNNYLEAAGENVMFGGADAVIPNMVTSDIEIRDNYFFKPLSWVGSQWVVKNLLEFKNAQRALVTHNRFENVWAAGQNGFAIVLTPRDQNGGAPWTTVRDIEVSNNVIVDAGSGFNILGSDDQHVSQLTYRLYIHNNVVTVNGKNGAKGVVFQVLRGPVDVTVDHNTAFASSPLGSSAIAYTETNAPGGLTDRFTFTNNLATYGNYGFFGRGTSDGLSTLTGHFSNYRFAKNAIIGGNTSHYPAGNFAPANVAAVQFVNYTGGDYRLAAGSPYKNAGTDGKDIGADVSLVPSGISGVAPPQPPSNVRVQ